MLPSIEAGVPIDEMQIGLSVRLRDVFWDNGQLARGGSEYVDNLPHGVQVRFRDALSARRQVFQQRLAAATTSTPETSPLVARLYDAAYTEIEPVLDRFALNDKMNDLALEAPNLKRYLTQTGLRPGGEAWLASLSEERQTRVRDAVADRNAIRNIGSRIVAASAILANPENDVPAAAAGIGRSTQDLMRLFNDSGLTETGRQYVSRLGLDRVHTVEYNLSRRNRQRAAMPSPAFSLSIPATPASQSELNLNLDDWRAQLMGQPAHASPAPSYPAESSFGMPQTPSGGWPWGRDTDSGAGPSNWHDEAASAAPPYSSQFSLSVPATPSSDADSRLNLDAWHAQLTEHPVHGSPAQAYSTESSFAMPQTPSGGWALDLNADADAGPSNWHDDATSAAPAYSREFSLSVPATPSSSADLNLDEWQAQLAGDAPHPIHAPESPRRAAIASAEAGPSTQDPILALLPSIAAGVPIAAMQAGVGVRLRTLFNEKGALSSAGREYLDTLGRTDKARFRNALASRRQAYRQAVAAQATASSSQQHDSAFVHISPILDRFALNERITHLECDVPAVRDYFTSYGLNARGKAWFESLGEDQQTRVRGVVADRTAIRNLGGHLPIISAFLADPANNLHAAASTLGCDVQDLHRLFNESGLTERGMQYVSRMNPDDGAAVLHNIQLRQSRSGALLPPAYAQPVHTAPSSSANAGLDEGAWQAQSMGQARHGSPAHIDPHDELRSIVDDLGQVPIAALQPRVRVPLSEYFVEDEGVTELGHRFLGTLGKQQQIQLELALRIPGDVMTFYEFTAIRDRFAAGVPRRSLLEQAPRASAYLSESGLVRGRGEAWFQRLPAERQAVIARAIADRRIIQAIAPRFIAISATFSNAANDMDEVARTAGVPAQDLGRFLTEDGLTALGQQFLLTCGIRTRQVIEANLALRHA